MEHILVRGDIQMVEAWGRGMPLILKNAPDVKFREISHIFIASFDRPSFVEDEEIADNGIGTTKETIKERPKKDRRTIKETTEETTEETTNKELRTAEKLVIEIIEANPVITQKELAVQMGLTEDGVYYHIKKLKAKGVLKHTGATKAGRWEIMK